MSGLAVALGRQLAEPRGVAGWLVGQAMRVVNRRPIRIAIDALRVQPGDVVLDLGCGRGDAVPRLLREARGGAVHGVDHSVGTVLSARDRHPGATFHVGTFEDLPLPRGSIDRVLAANVAYFWHDHGPVLAELRRIVRPGGRIAVYVTRARDLRRIGLNATGTHRLFEADDLQRMLGPSAAVEQVDAGFGVRGLVATLNR